MNIESAVIGQSAAAKKLRKNIAQFAKQRTPVVLHGPRGAGKTAVATFIHESSTAKGSLVALNPHSTSEAEIKSTLEKPNPKISTLVFQEIEEFSFLHQSMINTFINQSGKDPAWQVIATVKKDPDELQKEGKILEQLYETIKQFDEIEIPALNARSEDIPLFVEYFLKRTCESLGVTLKALDVNALDFLVRREWKENIRELKFVVEQAVLSSDEEMIELPKHLIDEYTQLQGMMVNIKDKKSFSFDKSLSNLEKTLIEKALDVVGYNQSKAAEILNISEANLRYRLKKFKIVPSRQK